MLDFQVYTDETLPDAYAYQRLAFIRMLWEDPYVEHPDLLLKSFSEPETRHFLVTAGEALVSAASVVRREIDCGGVPYLCYGLGAVMTFPFFRKRGYGRQVVKAATDYICAQPDADLALLWTSPNLEPWYGVNGWGAIEGMSIWFGDPEDPKHNADSYFMMQFFSERAKANRDAIIHSRIYIGQTDW